MFLEYAFSLSPEQEAEIKEAISEKIGFEVPITKKLNKDLISGFRLEIQGRLIENNLLNIIDNAIDKQ